MRSQQTTHDHSASQLKKPVFRQNCPISRDSRHLNYQYAVSSIKALSAKPYELSAGLNLLVSEISAVMTLAVVLPAPCEAIPRQVKKHELLECTFP